MFKIDIKDAFMRFWFFDWTSFPQYWGIVTRILVRVARLNGLKFLLGYVDVFSGFCLEKVVLAFIALFTKFV